MKRYSQSKKAKEEFLRTSLIALLMGGEPERVFTKEELSDSLGLNMRDTRRAIAELANYQAVIALSSRKGYRVLSIDENTPLEKLVEYADLIEHQLADFKSRVTNLKARMKPLVALKCVIEKKLQEGRSQDAISSKGCVLS